MKVNLKLLAGQSVVIFALFALALFVPAGTWAWGAGWVFWVLFLGFYVAINAWLFRNNPALLQERTRLASSDQQGWDKLLFPLMLLAFFGWLALMGWDAVRAHGSWMPLWLQGAGLVLLLASFYLLFRTFRENSYLSPVVRVQADRGQVVVSSGLYAHVRHPMYTGIAVFTVGTALLLGSWYGLLLGIILMAILARRAVLEEATLRQALPGYADYMAQVRYRLIPYVW